MTNARNCGCINARAKIRLIRSRAVGDYRRRSGGVERLVAKLSDYQRLL